MTSTRTQEDPLVQLHEVQMPVSAQEKAPSEAPYLSAIRQYLAPYVKEKQWCVWRYEQDRKNPQRRIKRPRQSRQEVAKTDDPSTWLSLEKACHVAQADDMDGIGLMLNGDLLGCDLDACYDPTTGLLEPWAQEIVDRLDSYTEISPSGYGVKIFIRGDIGGTNGVNVQWGSGVVLSDGTVKKYEIALVGGARSARYFTVTGQIYHPVAVREVDLDDVAWLRQKIEAVRREIKGSPEKRYNASSVARLSADSTPRAVTTNAASLALLVDLKASPKGDDLSANFHRLVTWCKSEGLTLAETAELMARHPQHIPERYAGRLSDEVRRSYDKGDEPEALLPSAPNAQADDELDAALVAMQLPEIDSEAFYGPLAEIVDKATAKTEATRVGVAIHLIGSIAAYFGRPFFVHIGDEDVGLNVFAVQVGPSALARKGTSAALADKRIMPGLCRLASELSQRIKDADEAAQAEFSAKQAVAAKLDHLREKRANLMALTEDNVIALEAQLKELRGQKKLEYARERLAILQGKLKDPKLSPRTLKEYQRDLEQVNCDIEVQERSEANMVCRIKSIQQALQNPDAALAEIDRALSQTETELLQPLTHNQTPAWMKVLANQAGTPVILTSLSSGEGLVHAIRDDREVVTEDGQTVMEPGVPEKRLFINVSEFGGPLAVMRRQGSTLSEKIRQGYDGTPLSTPSKGDPWSVAQHHICLSGAITPAELAGLLFDKKDTAANADNGVGNRPLFVYVRRTKLVPRPEPTDEVGAIVELLWQNIQRVYATLQPQGDHHSAEFRFTEDGAAEWDRCYAELDAMRGSSEQASKLHGRITTNARKLAPILAMIAGEPFVNDACVRAAIAWARYASATVDVVASTLKDRVKHHKVREHAETVWNAVREATEKSEGEFPTTRDIQRKTRLKQAELMAAVEWLLSQAPALMNVVEQRGRNGKPISYLSAQGEWR